LRITPTSTSRTGALPAAGEREREREREIERERGREGERERERYRERERVREREREREGALMPPRRLLSDWRDPEMRRVLRLDLRAVLAAASVLRSKKRSPAPSL
jgi:hypothetical protein